MTKGYSGNDAKRASCSATAGSSRATALHRGRRHPYHRPRQGIIIRAGRNTYPHEIEEAISAIPGIRKGGVAAFGSPDPRTAPSG